VKQSRRDFIRTCAAASIAVCEEPLLGATDDIAFLTLAAASDRVRKKSLSPVELTTGCLKRIERLNVLQKTGTQVEREFFLKPFDLGLELRVSNIILARISSTCCRASSGRSREFSPPLTY